MLGSKNDSFILGPYALLFCFPKAFCTSLLETVWWSRWRQTPELYCCWWHNFFSGPGPSVFYGGTRTLPVCSDSYASGRPHTRSDFWNRVLVSWLKAANFSSSSWIGTKQNPIAPQSAMLFLYRRLKRQGKKIYINCGFPSCHRHWIKDSLVLMFLPCRLSKYNKLSTIAHVPLQQAHKRPLLHAAWEISLYQVGPEQATGKESHVWSRQEQQLQRLSFRKSFLWPFVATARAGTAHKWPFSENKNNNTFATMGTCPVFQAQLLLQPSSPQTAVWLAVSHPILRGLVWVLLGAKHGREGKSSHDPTKDCDLLRQALQPTFGSWSVHWETLN